MIKSLFIDFIAVIAFSPLLHAADVAPRQQLSLDENWKFFLGDATGAEKPDFADTDWRTVTLPHDWSIEGKFDPHATMGGAGGFLPSGIGWYRQHLQVPANWDGKQVSVEFEGIYMDSDIWLNGQHLANHPYGYTSFNVDLTQTLKPGSDNVLAVRVDSSHQKNSRWYAGSGIYRHVWLTIAAPVHIVHWGVFVTVPAATEESANLNILTRVTNSGTSPQTFTVHTALVNPGGKEEGTVPDVNGTLAPRASQDFNQEVVLSHPALWSPETPQLYQTISHIQSGGVDIDKDVTIIGVRHLAWSTQSGLTLNGKTYKLNGGCIHGDNGCLGTAAFDRAEERKIELLKASGFNELRTAHNPPSPALLDACDRLGMLVMDEAFDCWTVGKNSMDYSQHFKDCWQSDIDLMIQRDRNHPSIVFWSIGNEIPAIFSQMGADYSPQLVERVHSLDKSRPVTNGILGWPHADTQQYADADWNALDIVGTNYALTNHIKQHDQFPNRILVSTESYPGNPSDRWAEVVHNDFVIGDNVWAAQDYLGECGGGRWFYQGDPTEPVNPIDPKHPDRFPFVSHGSDKLYPWHGDNSGDLDLIGHRKPTSHLRNIVWDEGEKLYMAVRQPLDDKKIMVAPWGIFPVWESWTWPAQVGKPMTVEVYSRYPSVRLYLNGTLVGEKPTTGKEKFRTMFDLTYQPGTLKAVGVQNGVESEPFILSTVGDPVAIRLTPDRAAIHADGQDLSFVDVDIVDKNGNIQPNATQNITFSVTGPGIIAGVGNADMKNEEPYQGNQRPAFHGRALVVIRSTKQSGSVQLNAQADGLNSSSLTITTK